MELSENKNLKNQVKSKVPNYFNMLSVKNQVFLACWEQIY